MKSNVLETDLLRRLRRLRRQKAGSAVLQSGV
jgi:hypothetical protein